jgi:hypothetical protein
VGPRHAPENVACTGSGEVYRDLPGGRSQSGKTARTKKEAGSAEPAKKYRHRIVNWEGNYFRHRYIIYRLVSLKV